MISSAECTSHWGVRVNCPGTCSSSSCNRILPLPVLTSRRTSRLRSFSIRSTTSVVIPVALKHKVNPVCRYLYSVNKTRLTPYSAMVYRPVEAHVVAHRHRAQALLAKTSNRRYSCLPDQRPLGPVLAVTCALVSFASLGCWRCNITPTPTEASATWNQNEIFQGITCTVGIPDPHTNCITSWSRCPSIRGMRRKFGEPSIRLQCTLSDSPSSLWS
jgi:hypothetical protein